MNCAPDVVPGAPFAIVIPPGCSGPIERRYDSLDTHPIDALRRAGVPVSINTDDPSLLCTSLPREYALCRKHYGWNDDIVRELAETSIAASFATDDVKARLRQQLAHW